MERDPVTLSIVEMDEQVRAVVSQARGQLENDKDSLERLDELVRLWHESCYRLMMSYTGLSLMRFAKAQYVQSILEMAHNVVPRNGSSGTLVFVD